MSSVTTLPASSKGLRGATGKSRKFKCFRVFLPTRLEHLPAAFLQRGSRQSFCEVGRQSSRQPQQNQITPNHRSNLCEDCTRLGCPRISSFSYTPGRQAGRSAPAGRVLNREPERSSLSTKASIARTGLSSWVYSSTASGNKVIWPRTAPLMNPLIR